MESIKLKRAFHQEMIILFKRMNKEVKYKPTRLLDLINKYGGYEAAVKYVSTEGNVQDFGVLWEAERLDLSVEALITKPAYRDLFPEEIVNYCDKKLAEYSYAPQKIVEEKSFDDLFDDIFAELKKEREEEQMQILSKDYRIYKEELGITEEQWQQIIVKENIFTAKNKDLVLRIYLIGDYVTPAELSIEEGYSATYPYNEVITALGKRIKLELKVDAPRSRDNKLMWWHLLFMGGVKDNSSFEWSLRKELRAAIKTLIENGEIDISNIEVKTNRDCIHGDTTDVEETLEVEIQMEEEIPVSTIIPKTVNSEIVSEPIEEVSYTQMGNKPTADYKGLEALSAQLAKVQQSAPAEDPMKIEILVEEEPIESSQAEMLTTDAQKEALKAACIEYYGAICDLCGFDYGYTYGEAFETQIEVHHIHSTTRDEYLPGTDPVKDLIPICHNCHNVIHSTVPPITVEAMRKMIKA